MNYGKLNQMDTIGLSVFNVLKSMLYLRVNPIELSKKISPFEFLDPSAVVLFNTCIELASEGEEWHLKSVRIKLDEQGILKIHDPFLRNLWEYQLPDFADIDSGLDVDIYNIKNAYKRKQLEDLFLTASMKLMNQPDKVDEVLKDLSDFSNDLKANDVRSSDIVKISEDMFPKLTDMLNGVSELKGSPLFGISELDLMIRGFVPGDVVLIAGRPKMGKSTTENTIMHNLILSDVKFASFSGEQRNQTRWINLLAALSDESYLNIEDGKDYDFKKIESAYEILSNKQKENFFHLYQDQLSLPFIRERVFYHYYNHDVRVFLIDRIGLFKEIDSRNDHTSRTRVTSEIRALANQLDITFVLFSQCNANLDNTPSKRPTPSSVYGNTGVLANCTKGLLLYRPDEYGFTEFPEDSKKFRGQPCGGKIEVIGAIGNRMGRGSVKLKFDYEKVKLRTEILGYQEKLDNEEVPF